MCGLVTNELGYPAELREMAANGSGAARALGGLNPVMPKEEEEEEGFGAGAAAARRGGGGPGAGASRAGAGARSSSSSSSSSRLATSTRAAKMARAASSRAVLAASFGAERVTAAGKGKFDVEEM